MRTYPIKQGGDLGIDCPWVVYFSKTTAEAYREHPKYGGYDARTEKPALLFCKAVEIRVQVVIHT